MDFAQLFSNDKRYGIHWDRDRISLKSSYRNFQPLLDILSLWFQIRDDYCNLQSEEVLYPPYRIKKFYLSMCLSMPKIKRLLMTSQRENSHFP